MDACTVIHNVNLPATKKRRNTRNGLIQVHKHTHTHKHIKANRIQLAQTKGVLNCTHVKKERSNNNNKTVTQTLKRTADVIVITEVPSHACLRNAYTEKRNSPDNDNKKSS
jgi:hypothetical protein